MNTHSTLHERALKVAREFKRAEFQLVEVLQEVERNKTHQALGHSSLFVYATKALGLTESVAYALIAVARKAKEVKALGRALATGDLAVGKASRIVSALTEGNAQQLIQFAKTHTQREIDSEVVRLKPKSIMKDRIQPVQEGLARLEINVPSSLVAKLKRAQDLSASRGRAHQLVQVLEQVLDEHLDRHDPVRRADRAQKSKLCANRAGQATPPSNRIRLKARETHAVHARDRGRCTFKDQGGKRCDNSRWLHIHHIRPVEDGGSNAPENLTTLCAFHHRHVHGD